MERPRLEVADVLRRYGEAYREQHAASLSTAQRRVMSAIELCRTAALVTGNTAINAPTNALATTRAATGIAQSASLWPAPSGSRIVNPNSSTPNTSMSSLLSRKRLPPSLTRTRKWCTTFSFGPLLKPCATIAADPKRDGLRNLIGRPGTAHGYVGD